jgi:hypothetical protein
MYNETQICRIMELRERRWSLLRGNEKKSLSDNRSAINTVNRQLYQLTGRQQYL